MILTVDDMVKCTVVDTAVLGVEVCGSDWIALTFQAGIDIVVCDVTQHPRRREKARSRDFSRGSVSGLRFTTDLHFTV